MSPLASLPRSAMSQLSLIQSTQKAHTLTFALAVAYVIASRLELPAEAGVDIQGHYRMHYLLDVQKKISRINELVPHQMNLAEKIVRELLDFRYLSVHPAPVPTGGGLRGFTGLQLTVSPEVLDLIEANDPDLGLLIGSVTALMAAFAAQDAAM